MDANSKNLILSKEKLKMKMNDVNMTAGKLKEILSEVPDDMLVVIPAFDHDDENRICGFRYVRTAGILNDGLDDEDSIVLCLSTSPNGAAIKTQVEMSCSRDIICDKVLF